MVFITPFKGDFAGEKDVTIYAVNTHEPERASSSVSSHEKCSHCGEKHTYMFVDMPISQSDVDEEGWVTEGYECKCPSCEMPFTVELEFEI